MEFSTELELVCIGICNELRFKLIRGHIPKLGLINLIPWLLVEQPGELGKSVPLGQPLMLYQDVSAVHQHCCVADQDVVVSVTVGSRCKQSLSGMSPGRIHLFLPSSAVSALVISS